MNDYYDAPMDMGLRITVKSEKNRVYYESLPEYRAIRTVGDFIEALSKFPSDAPVLLKAGQGLRTVGNVEIVNLVVCNDTATSRKFGRTVIVEEPRFAFADSDWLHFLG